MTAGHQPRDTAKEHQLFRPVPGGSWRVMFRYRKEQYTFWLGQVEEHEARATAAKVDYWLMRLKQHLDQFLQGVLCGDFCEA